ncbi:MAG: FkbM family methyltransferase [Holosporaceae bacterium]|jgi:FkbM family methyltransferase|nr:FkbM family methyltransferase [Holosporaceae bacterium]
MFKIYKMWFALIALVFFFELKASEGTKETTEVLENSHVVEVYETDPAVHDKFKPVVGWERYTSDTACSVKGWIRWWKYLRIKKPIIMRWVNNLILRIHPNNEIFRALFVRGIYDPNLVVMVNAFLPRGGILLDVGANMGYISLWASKVVGAEGCIYAIEPSSRDYTRLVDNININGLNKIIFSYQLALSEKSGQRRLLIAAEERSALNTVGSEIVSKGVEIIGDEVVNTLTLDEFIEKEKIQRMDVLKLDIEGSEVKALRGAKDTLKKHHPAIILGFNRNALKSCDTDYLELQKILDESGYCVYEIVERPVFALVKVIDISKVNSRIVVCLPKETIPPTLPQAEKTSVVDCIYNFFLR